VGTFQWTSAVKALAVLFVRTAAAARADEPQPCIIGGHGSLAMSLDYAIAKAPRWLCEMFGQTPSGELYARRVFRITNSHGKRPGPVVLAVNPLILSGTEIDVLWHEQKVDAEEFRTLLDQLEQYERERSLDRAA
jgi:hypothetical protein